MTDAEFKAELAQIYAQERRQAANEAAIERRLAEAWFASHPEDFPRCVWHHFVEWYQMIHGVREGAWKAWGGR
jgi:hypothetical protein